MFIVGNVLSSTLLIATLWLWAHVANEIDHRKSFGADNQTLGAVFGTFAALFFIGMAWYSVLDHKMRHDLLALSGAIATYAQSGFMIAAAVQSQNAAAWLWRARL
jgi:hypothetical protein